MKFDITKTVRGKSMLILNTILGIANIILGIGNLVFNWKNNKEKNRLTAEANNIGREKNTIEREKNAIEREKLANVKEQESQKSARFEQADNKTTEKNLLEIVNSLNSSGRKKTDEKDSNKSANE